MTLSVQVVSPERILWAGDASRVIARTVEGGEIAFLTGHVPFVGALEIAQVRIQADEGSDELVLAVHGGFVEVSNDEVSLLTDVAELAEQIDTDRAREARDRARQVLNAESDDAEAAAAVRRAEVRLEVTGSHIA